MNADTIVILYDVTEWETANAACETETETWRGTIADFLRDNEFLPLEIGMIVHHLLSGGAHYFGGGAEPLTVLRLA